MGTVDNFGYSSNIFAVDLLDIDNIRAIQTYLVFCSLFKKKIPQLLTSPNLN